MVPGLPGEQPGLHGRRWPRLAEVRTLNPAAAGGRLSQGHLLLRQSARYPYIASALISPDGSTITAVVLSGQVQPPSTVGRRLAVVQISAATGRRLRTLYQRRAGVTFGWLISPGGPGRWWLLVGFSAFGNGDGPPRLQHQGYNGWIDDGQLIPLRPAPGQFLNEAW